MTTATLGLQVTSNADKAAADLDKLTASSQKAEAAATSLASGTKAAATSAQQLVGVAEAEARALMGVTAAANSNAAAMRVQGGAASQAIRLTSFETTNLAAQINDMGVMLASGQSPFILFMQQGMQVSQLFNARGFGLIDSAKAFGAGLMSFVTNPLNLMVVGVAVASTAIAGLWSAISNSGEADKALEEHERLIDRIKDRYGEAIVKATEYDQVSRGVLQFESERNVQTQIETVANLRAELSRSLQSILSGTTDPFSGTAVPGYEELNALIQQSVAGLQMGTMSADELTEAFARLGRSDPASDVALIAEEVNNLAEALDEAEDRARQANSLNSILGGRFVNPFAPTAREAERDSMRAFWGELGIDPDAMIEAQIAAQEKLSEVERRAAETTKDRGKAVVELIDSMQFELSLIGQSAEQQAISNALRQAGADATEAQREQIAGLASEIYKAEEAQRAFDEAQKEAIQRMDQFRSTAKGVIGELLEGDIEGAINRIQLKLFDALSTSISDAFFGPRGEMGGGLFGGIVQNLLGGAGERGSMANPMYVIPLPGVGGLASNILAAPLGAVTGRDIGFGGPAIGSFRAAQELGLQGILARSREAIAAIESMGSGDYSALGPLTGGDRAYGRYQVMGANIPSWTRDALGRSMTPSQFLGSPSAQDAVFDHRFGGYLNRYGNVQDAASTWFTGRPLAQGAGASDILGTTGSEYVDRFMRELGETGEGITAAADKFKRGFDGSLEGLANGMQQTVGAFGPAFGNTLQGLLQQFQQGGGGGSFGGFLNSIFGGGFYAGPPLPGAGLFDDGGMITANSGWPVGPQHRAIIGKIGERVLTEEQQRAGAMQRVHVTVGVATDDNGNLMPFVQSVSRGEVEQAAPRIVGTAVRTANQQVVPTFNRYQQETAGSDYRI